MKSKDSTTWTTQEVEKYTQKLMNKSEVTISEQREKINFLTIKNAKLTRDLHDAKMKEKRAIRAMTEASLIAKDSAKVSSMQSSLEVAKIKAFADKWISYFDTLSTFATPGDFLSAKNEFENDAKTLIDEIVESANLVTNGEDIVFNKKKHIDLTNSDLIISGASTQEKLSKDDEKRYNNILKEVKSQMIHADELTKESDSGFSFEEALNPTDSLDDIVKDILE